MIVLLETVVEEVDIAEEEAVKAAVPLSFITFCACFAPGRTFPILPPPGLTAGDPGSLTLPIWYSFRSTRYLILNYSIIGSRALSRVAFGIYKQFFAILLRNSDTIDKPYSLPL